MHGVGISKVEVSEAACPQMMQHSIGGNAMVRACSSISMHGSDRTMAVSHQAAGAEASHEPRRRARTISCCTDPPSPPPNSSLAGLVLQLPGMFYVEAVIEASGGVPCILTGVEFQNRCLIPPAGESAGGCVNA